jgi:tRNA-splicing ligase RtcB
MPERAADKVLAWGRPLMEQGTIDQAAKASRMPFVPGHVALMPDAHVGIGATVGSVIPTEGAVIPAAVGVDIGCVDKDSEYLSPAGWRKISEYDGGLVMQYVPGYGVGRFVQPEAFVVQPCESFYRLRTKYGIDQVLTADHRVLCWKVTGRDRRTVMTTMTADHFAAEHARLKQGFKARFATTFIPDLATEIDLTAEEIRVQVMVNADGHLDDGGRKAVVRLKKERKIERARKLLANAGISWTENVSADEVTAFRFRPPLYSKSYESFWPAHLNQLMHVTDECLNWDGNVVEGCFYTRDKESADFIHYAFTACGRRAVLRADVDEDGKLDYRVFRHDKTMVSMAGVPKTPITMVPAEDGKAYCFKVPSGFWVMRRGGNIVMTGNCGMVASETSLTAADLPDLGTQRVKVGKETRTLMSLIEQRIPAGVGKGHDPDHWTIAVAPHFAAYDAIGLPFTSLSPKQRATAEVQFGTLGSGNHFVEVCLDERDVVWTVLHSGSRGIGNQLATMHINAAKGVMKKTLVHLEDPDLAYLAEGTDEFSAYIHDMLWAQRYAMASREQMVGALTKSLFQVVGKGKVVRTINCHHNFTQREEHLGRELWITRKGAIKAGAGDEGIIPGSMGTRSYVVSGLANTASYLSCSHGAGRRLSRGQARRELTGSSLKKAMTGRTWNEDRAKDLVDEHPQAYKDIDLVMEAQSDLCRVQHVLSQVLNYKG